MVVLSTFVRPTEGIRHLQPNTTVFVNENNLGKGSLYIAESQLSWVSDSGNGFSIQYPHISLHAISRDLNSFPQECLFVMLDTNIEDDENFVNLDGFEENGTGDQGATYLRFVPDDKGMLDAMYHAMNACQALHPDPEGSISDEDFFEDAYDDFPINETHFRMAGLTIENRDGLSQGYMSEEWLVGRARVQEVVEEEEAVGEEEEEEEEEQEVGKVDNRDL